MSAAKTVVSSTGEALEFDTSTPEAVLEAYKVVNDYLDSYDRLKKQLQTAATKIVDERGQFEHDGWLLRVYTTQRMSYDPIVLRDVFDEDLLASFMEPAKGRIDRYIKEHVNELGAESTRLRQSMVPAGKPYQVVRVERTV